MRVRNDLCEEPEQPEAPSGEAPVGPLAEAMLSRRAATLPGNRLGIVRRMLDRGPR